MGLSIKKVDKIGNDSIIEEIREDYHNGECEFLPSALYQEQIRTDLRYLVVDNDDHMLLIYPE